jgi:N-acetylglutamate synthase-like GNAT family acetyltransferase
MIRGHMLQLRQFRAADEAAVHELHEVAQDGILAPADLSAIPDAYLTAGGDFLVGEIDGELVAMGALRRVSSASAEIKRMRVHPRWQGQGFGRELLDRLEARARELGFTTLRLDTTTRQHAARALYEDAGYRMVGTGQENGFELVYYEKRLA